MRILEESDIVESSGCMTSRNDFSMKFKTFMPKRVEWRKGAAPLTGDSAQIYTDGSKLEGAIGIGIYSKSIGIYKSMKLPDLCNVFQTEVSVLGR